MLSRKTMTAASNKTSLYSSGYNHFQKFQLNSKFWKRDVATNIVDLLFSKEFFTSTNVVGGRGHRRAPRLASPCSRSSPRTRSGAIARS